MVRTKRVLGIAALLLAAAAVLAALAGCGGATGNVASSDATGAQTPGSGDGYAQSGAQTDAVVTEAPMNEATARVYDSLEPGPNQFVIVYDLNGGDFGSMLSVGRTVRDSATGKIQVRGYEGCFVQTVTDSYYICPHSMGDKGYLRRDGYVLYGYNTMPDGSGEYFGCGWNVPVGLGGKRVLYAMWAEETDSSDLIVTGTVLNRFRGTGSVAVVPEGITEIAPNAFISRPDLETVILPKTVRTVGTAAFSGCSKLTTVYMYDLIFSMSADSFRNCDSFTRLYLNNANQIKYLGSMKQGSYMCKFQRLKVMADRKKIVLIGGSNLCYGLDSALLKQLLEDEYEIVNWGTMYYLPSAFFVDAASCFMREGDIIVTCPEEEPAQWGQIWNGGEMNYASYLFYSCEGCLDVFSCVDMVKYRKLLTSIAKYNQDRSTGSNSYESYNESESVNQYGDFDYERTQKRRISRDANGKLTGWGNTGYLSWIGRSRCANFFQKENVDALNGAFDACTARGARVFISFSATDEYYFSDTSDETVRAYEEDIRRYYVYGHEGVSLISGFRTYLMDDSKFYNSMHHLLWDAAQERTRLLYSDIRAALRG